MASPAGKPVWILEVLADAFRNIGAVVMGRRMFDLSLEPWGANPPFHTPVFVVTHTGPGTHPARKAERHLSS